MGQVFIVVFVDYKLKKVPVGGHMTTAKKRCKNEKVCFQARKMRGNRRASLDVSRWNGPFGATASNSGKSKTPKN